MQRLRCGYQRRLRWCAVFICRHLPPVVSCLLHCLTACWGLSKSRCPTSYVSALAQLELARTAEQQGILTYLASSSETDSRRCWLTSAMTRFCASWVVCVCASIQAI